MNSVVMCVPWYLGTSLPALVTMLLATWLASTTVLNVAFACSQSTVEDNTLAGCRLLAAVADRLACSKSRS